jgi:hypothetical protein
MNLVSGQLQWHWHFAGSGQSSSDGAFVIAREACEMLIGIAKFQFINVSDCSNSINMIAKIQSFLKSY